MTRFREKTRSMLPKGVATFTPEATFRKRLIEESLIQVFMQWGYQEVITPLFEYLDVISSGLSEELIEKGYKLVDRSNGRLMLLRPDVTPQIARMVAMLMSDQPKPLRLCYRANVYRHEEEHAGRSREIFQIGGELIGLEGSQADAEVIAIAVESLLRVGLKDFKIALGHTEFFRGILDDLKVPPETRHRIRMAVSRKDITGLREMIKDEKIPSRKARALLEMPLLFGGIDAIQKARILTDGPFCQRALIRIREVYDLIDSIGFKDFLLIDLSEVRGFDYYTGIVFEVFVKDMGYAVGRGGRYDELIGRFGEPCPSTGFAFDIDQVQSAWQQHLSMESQTAHPHFYGADLLVADSKRRSTRLFQMAGAARKEGVRVIQQAGVRNLQEAMQYSRSVDIPFVAYLEKGDQVLLVRMESGRIEKLTMKKCITRIVRLRESTVPHKSSSSGSR